VVRARELIPLLAEYRPQRILSSPYVRCCATVQPLAESLGLAVESVDELAEGHGVDAVRLVSTMAGESAVLCTHGDVATELLEALVPEAEDPARKAFRLQKGEVWVVQSTDSRSVIAQHIRRLPASARGPKEDA
jgi:8-oxo-dGTP diphosphatase